MIQLNCLVVPAIFVHLLTYYCRVLCNKIDDDADDADDDDEVRTQSLR